MDGNKRLVELEDRVIELEVQLNDAKDSIEFLVEYIHDIEEQLKNTSSLWKKEQQKQFGLSNVSVGLPRIDDDAIVKMTEQGLSITAQAKVLNCSRTTIIKHRNRLKSEGRI